MADRYDVLAVELSSFQLHWSTRCAAHAAAVLNIAPDHVDWHGASTRYAADKGRIYRGVDGRLRLQRRRPGTERSWPTRPTAADGCRAIGFTLGVARGRQLGVVEDLLVDRAFVDHGGPSRPATATELAGARRRPPVGPAQRRQRAGRRGAGPGLRRPGRPRSATACARSSPDAHRIAEVADPPRRAATWTTPRPPTRTPPPPRWPHSTRVVWIAGGLAKGADVRRPGRRRRRPGCAAPCCSAPTAP